MITEHAGLMRYGPMRAQNQLIAWLLRRTAASGIRRVAPLSAALASDPGNVRDDNQDRAVVVRGGDGLGREYAAVVVADGIGGMRDGATAAAIAVGAFVIALDKCAREEIADPGQWLRKAIFSANEAVVKHAEGDGGATLVALLMRDGFPIHWISVGDSRVYRLEGKSLHQISVDDTIAGQLGKEPAEAYEQSKLLQFVGMKFELDPNVGSFHDSSGSALLLTTDGVHYLSSSGLLGSIVLNSPDPGVCVKRLVDLAKWCGGPDNATVAMVMTGEEGGIEPRPPYKCLEVWDSYGEVQIIVNEDEENIAALRQIGGGRSSGASALPVLASPALMSQHDDLLDKNKYGNADKAGGKIRKSRAGRKAKPKAVEEKKDSEKISENDAPQLFMEFPTKSGDG